MQTDMTTGRPMKVIAAYALPLLAGNLMQQLYNVVDTIVVGRFVGSDALAAVGSSFTVFVLVNSVIIGLCMGAGVVVARHYGAKDYASLRATVATSAAFLLFVTLLLTALAQIFLPPLLTVYRMPQEIRGDAQDYLRILFSCLLFTCCYNAAAFLLRAVGDSRSPLIFLILSMLLNVGLDLLFVLAFGMRVRGVALATIIAQGISALCAMAYAGKKLDFLRGMSWRPVLTREILAPVARFSIFTGLQQSIMNLGGLLVQGLVNSYGIAAMAAFAACGKIDAFIHLPVQDFGGALATFVAQNLGARRADRVRSGLRFTVAAVVAYCAVVSALVLLLKDSLLTIFIDPGEAAVLAIGGRYLSVVACFYAGIGILAIFYGYYRGVGRPQLSLALTIVSLGTRVATAYALSAVFGVVDTIWWAIPLGWGLADLVGLTFYFTFGRRAVREHALP